MKKRKRKKITASGIAASVMLAVTSFLPGCNKNETVYGPPEMFGMEDPGDNYNEDVYGPPEYFEEVEEDTPEEAPENDGNDQNE